MAFLFNGKKVENVKLNGQQLEVLRYNGKIIWENWKLKHNLTVGTQPETGYNTRAKFVYTVPSTIKPKTIKCDAWVTNHINSETATVKAIIDIKWKSGTWTESVAFSTVVPQSSKGTKHITCVYEVPADQQEQIQQIRFTSYGNQFKRGVTGILEEYYEKGSA